jgi:hypothetical protein
MYKKCEGMRKSLTNKAYMEQNKQNRVGLITTKPKRKKQYKNVNENKQQ